MRKLWLDDIMAKPGSFHIHCHNYEEAVLELSKGDIEYISFDHDLGWEDYEYNAAGNIVLVPANRDHEKTGYDVAKAMIEMVAAGEISMPKWAIHSMNPVGRKNICELLTNFEKQRQ